MRPRISETGRPSLLAHLVFGSDTGGLERDVLALIRGAPQVQHQVILAGSWGPMADQWRDAGASVMTYSPSLFRPWNTSRTLRRILRQSQPSGLIAWFGMVRLPQVIRACNQLDVPLVVHAGNPVHEMPLSTELRYQIMSWLFQPSGKLPLYVCCSKYVADSLRSSKFLSRFPSCVVYNGIEMPDEPTHRVRQFDPARPFIVGMTARLNHIKDHATLIRAVAHARKSLGNLQLEVAGSGGMLGQLVGLAKELEIEKHVCFLGNVKNVYKRLQKWDLFAYATTPREGLGNSLSEALAFGLPSVVTEVGPMTEFQDSPETIRLVPPADPIALGNAITNLARDELGRQKLSDRARRFALLRFSPQQFTNRHLELLHIPIGPQTPIGID